MAGPGQYAAFISYSSHDAAFARRLHGVLEGYRVPSGAGSFNLAGKQNRVAPVFLDRAELSSGELGSAISSAIENSTALIVVCSPHAAKSQWVDKEIRHFVQTGRVRRIFAIIASGEPFASSHGAADNECFPQALRDMAAGKLGDPYEVVAGDARPGKDGFGNAWLKVAAGILDVSFGKLLDRDAAARRGRTLMLGTAAAVVAAVVGTLTTFWFLESQRFQNEARATLLREARSAFELDDSARAMTALASLVPGMPADDRAKYQPVLDAWSARFPHLAASIANAPVTFAYSERVFFKTPEGIIATPLPAEAVLAASLSEETVLAIDFSSRVWQWRRGEAEAKDLQLPVEALGKNDWASAVKLKGGGAVFGGTIQASSYGGQDPVVLVVNEAAGSFALIDYSHLSSEDLRLAPDCSVLGYVSGTIDYAFGTDGDSSSVEEIVTGAGFKRLDLRSASAGPEDIPEEVFETIPPLKLDLDGDDDRATAVLKAIAEACGAGGVTRGPPASLTTMPAIAARDIESGVDVGADEPATRIWNWVTLDRYSEQPVGDPPEVARIVVLTDAIQRAQLDMGKITRIRDGEIDKLPPQEDTFIDGEPDPEEDAEMVSLEYGIRLSTYLALDDAMKPTLSFDAAEGKYVGSNVCGFADGKAKCINMLQNGHGVEFAAFPDFIYAGGTNYLGYPLFTLIDRQTFNAVEFRSDRLNITTPAYAGSVALSPSGKQMAIAFARTVLLFELDDNLVPRLSKRLDVPGLAEGADTGLRGVCAALTYLDEATLIASRGDGLNLRLDLLTGEEMWRYRLPASVGCDGGKPYVPVQVVVSADGKRLAVRGTDFIAVLNTDTGLPLLPLAKFSPVMRWEDEGLYTEDTAGQIAGEFNIEDPAAGQAPAMAGDEQTCTESGVGCRTIAQLTRSARNLAKVYEPLLAIGASGEVWARTLSFDLILPPPGGGIAMAMPVSPQCFTGWKVAGSRIEPFDLMKDVKIGAPPIAEADLLAQCREGP